MSWPPKPCGRPAGSPSAATSSTWPPNLPQTGAQTRQHYRDEARWRSGFMAYLPRRDPALRSSHPGQSGNGCQLADQGVLAGKAAKRLGAPRRRNVFQSGRPLPRSYYATVPLVWRSGTVGTGAGADSIALPSYPHPPRPCCRTGPARTARPTADAAAWCRRSWLSSRPSATAAKNCENEKQPTCAMHSLVSRITPRKLRHAFPRLYFDRIQTAAREAG